jgi:hypothetical protein
MPTFQQIVQSFHGYDLDGDRVPEIESLGFLPFEDPAAAVESGRFVVVLVEERLFATLAGSRYRADDLLNRLRTYKADLLREGRQSRFLKVRSYAGSIHQDGKTLLAIREFFIAVRAAVPAFEGAILVGSFPEASIVRTWPQAIGDVDAPERPDEPHTGPFPEFRVGLTPGQPRPFDIVLGDLTGNWRSLYCASADAEGFTFRMTPRTQLSQSGTKVILQNALVQRTVVNLRDVFWIRDAAFRITGAPPNQRVEIDLACLDPEVSAADRARPNHVARPDISVSRINARSVAVQPPSSRLLDAAGKPTATPSSPAIPMSMESWRADPGLERTLLVEYFDRNHAFRTAAYAERGFAVSAIEYQLGTVAVDEGMGALAHPRSEVRNAALVDFVRWLKSNAAFRAVGAHADCFSTSFRQDDAAAPVVESECGGRPWRWLDRGGQYLPSFDGHHTGDLYLYRTLWENRQLANVMPSLMLHVGCDVSGVSHADRPYHDAQYGTFQNAQALLFYGNQLAIVCHATWWNRGPFGFGDALTNSPTAVLGDGWKALSEHVASDAVLAQQSTERKQNYIWNVAGDWTLQRFYPVWPYARTINSIDATPRPPAAAVFRDSMYLFWKANDASNHIFVSASSDGTAFRMGRVTRDVYTTVDAPAACAFNNKLYLFWVARDPQNRIFVSPSADGLTWPGAWPINPVDRTPGSVTACVFRDKLYLFWKADDASNRIFFSGSADGKTWPAGRTLNGVDATAEAPTACVLSDKLYLFWRANDGSGRILFSVSSDGAVWPRGKPVNAFDTTAAAPAACAFDGRVFLFWKANDRGDHMYCSSSIGDTWPSAHRINEFDTTGTGPIACAMGSRLFLFWKADDASNRIFATVNDAGHRM